MKKFRRSAALLLLAVSSLFAQSDRGTLTGTVSDSSGSLNSRSHRNRNQSREWV